MQKVIMVVILIFCILFLMLSVSSYIFSLEIPRYIQSFREWFYVLIGLYIIFVIVRQR
ncbi:hypothetical protein C8J48_2749 [Desmospora activa DSM 45169]|uniref:Uncharacterized protein n=1 Tax=Desmospora activa DSM 45169 TaxID=1121389 RepID=A0A2T4Z3G1_9BACL|nr:hypothetical protein C8J48_2749 [Desmospora activa DSM 45169]